jgi:hypothetical protein
MKHHLLLSGSPSFWAARASSPLKCNNDAGIFFMAKH